MYLYIDMYMHFDLAVKEYSILHFNTYNDSAAKVKVRILCTTLIVHSLCGHLSSIYVHTYMHLSGRLGHILIALSPKQSK